MSRNQNSQQWVFYSQQVSVPPFDVWEPYQFVPTAGQELKELARSNVVPLPKDNLGWRGFTNYDVDDFRLSSWQGSCYREQIHPSQGIYRKWMEDGSFDQQFGQPPFEVPGWGDVSQNTINRTVVKALLKARDQKINAALAIAEMNKSIETISSRFTKLYQGYRQARKGNFRAAAVALGVDKKGKKSASSWLELQYGWLPLLSDIHGAYEEIQKRKREHGFVFKVEANGSEVDNRFQPLSDDRTSGSLSSKVVRRVKIVLWYQVDYDYLVQASDLGLTNPMEIAWELTPWSFVLDWAIPIGDVLGAMTAASGLTYKGGTRTLSTRGELVGNRRFKSFSADGYNNKCEGEANCSVSRFKMRREILHSSPIPLPHVKNPVSTGHALNAMALLRGLFK